MVQSHLGCACRVTRRHGRKMWSAAGASGGAATAHQPIAPQFIPVSQLVLMTMKVVQEMKAEG